MPGGDRRSPVGRSGPRGLERRFDRLLELLARWYPWSAEASETLSEAVAALGWRTSPEGVVRAGYVAGLLVGLLVASFPLAFLGWLAALSGVVLGLATAHVVHTAPIVWLRLRRASALGDAPGLVSRAVLRMRLSPSPERAAAFAAANGDGLLAAELATHVDRARHTGGSALGSFGGAWGERFPPLGRALSLVRAAGSVRAERRDRLLDRALGTVLEGTRERTREFAAGIRGPATGLYAFGVLLPTALIALLPAAGAAGVAVTPTSVALAYNVAVPALLVGAGVWLLARRPVAFPPPNAADHPDAAVGRGALPAGLAVGIAAWLATTPALPSWGPPVAAVGFGVGVALWARYRPVVAVYGEIREGERELADALALAGRRVADGRPVETAIAETAPELDGPMGEAFAACTRRQRRLQVGVAEAFLGRHGALSRLPSPHVRGSVALLALAAREGRPAGEALLSLSEHAEKLRRIERETHHELAYVCQTLASTAALFGPLVAGSTVALADGMAGETFGGGELSLGWLGGPVGVYVLVLAAVLSVLSTGLRRGLDSPLVAHRVGRTLVCATATYICAFALVGVVA